MSKLADLIEKAGMTKSDFAEKITGLAQYCQENKISSWIVAASLGAMADEQKQIQAFVTIMLTAQAERKSADQVTAAAYKSSLN